MVSQIRAWQNAGKNVFSVPLKGNQSPETLLTMRICFAIIPALFSVLAIYLLARYPLTGARMAEIRAALETRRSKI
jgi:GPH family glycoside/pentoside/hexuronide:cation symporter